MRPSRTGQHAWTLLCALTAIGFGLLLADVPVAPVALGAGLLGLGLRGLRSSAARRPGSAWAALAAFAVALAGGALALGAWDLPSWTRVAAGALAAQALLAALGAHAGQPRSALRRWALPAVGHATALCGTLLAVLARDPFTPASVLAYASGFSALLLHAHWAQRGAPGRADRDGAEGWEVAVLGTVVLAVGAMTLAAPGDASFLPVPEGVERGALAGAVGAGVAGLALLCRPPPAPAFLRARGGGALDVLAHGGAAIALLNVLFLGFSLVSGWSLKLVFAALFAWQLVVIGMEYRTLRHAERRRRRARAAPAPRRSRGPVTVVVPAADEAAVLPESLARNLSVPYPLRFILVPATKSTDGTVEVAHALAARHPDRVGVVEGSTGSKAEDLNLAWRAVATPLVLLLDADETIDEASLLRGLDALDAQPDVGVVQGRKVSRAPGDGFLARFISAERRYCTWMDHVMHGEDLGSSHFGGSAALLRREVPASVGGWTDQTMTEDIEFTLRLHLAGRWRIAYDPEMVVRECDPRDLQELLRQRTRWARGWAQCFGLYLPRVVERRRALGRRRAFGLLWLLLIAVSALWTTFVPAMLLMRLAGVSPLLPLAVAFPLTLILLPSRLLAYGYAAFRDPVIPLPRTPARCAELVLHAYLWILLGWFVQLHALYLELSSAPRVWHVTGKRAAEGKARAARVA